jgi:hypothetical protein
MPEDVIECLQDDEIYSDHDLSRWVVFLEGGLPKRARPVEKVRNGQ